MFDFLSSLILNQSLPLLECHKNVIILFEKVNPNLSRVVINESEKVICTTLWGNFWRTLKIRMNIIHSSLNSMDSWVEIDSLLLSKNIILIKLLLFFVLSPLKRLFLLIRTRPFSLIWLSLFCYNCNDPTSQGHLVYGPFKESHTSRRFHRIAKRL